MSTEPNPEEDVADLELWKQLRAGIQRIEPDYREILVLRDIEGLSAKEVAEVVELSVPAVKSRLHRARGQLLRAPGVHSFRAAARLPGHSTGLLRAPRGRPLPRHLLHDGGARVDLFHLLERMRWAQGRPQCLQHRPLRGAHNGSDPHQGGAPSFAGSPLNPAFLNPFPPDWLYHCERQE